MINLISINIFNFLFKNNLLFSIILTIKIYYKINSLNCNILLNFFIFRNNFTILINFIKRYFNYSYCFYLYLIFKYYIMYTIIASICDFLILIPIIYNIFIYFKYF